MLAVGSVLLRLDRKRSSARFLNPVPPIPCCRQGNTVLECFLSYSQWGQLPGPPTGRSDPPGSGYKWDLLPIRLVVGKKSSQLGVDSRER